jgi:hypothetical protein
MKRAFVQSRYKYYSEKASDRVRQLGFAGIALIWIFRRNANGELQLPEQLIPPALALILALACDFLQYVAGTLIWAVYGRWLEFRKMGKDTEFQAPDAVNWPALICFWSKICLMAIAYALIVHFLCAQLWIPTAPK